MQMYAQPLVKLPTETFYITNPTDGQVDSSSPIVGTGHSHDGADDSSEDELDPDDQETFDDEGSDDGTALSPFGLLKPIRTMRTWSLMTTSINTKWTPTTMMAMATLRTQP